MRKFTPKATKICPNCPNVDLTLDEPKFNFKMPTKTAKKETVVKTLSKIKQSGKKEALF